jgi:hypothetical protein
VSGFRDLRYVERYGLVQAHELADLAGTKRLTDFSAGFDQIKLQRIYQQAYIQPGYFDSYGIDAWSLEGKFQLAPACQLISSDSLDYEFLYYQFNNALYRLPTANFDATKFQKLTTATGTPTWTAIANPFPGTGIRNAVVWREQLYVATGENNVRVMSTAEAWTVLAAPAAVTTALAGQVGISQDDRLLVWWESYGMYAFDMATATTVWTKIFPQAANTSTASAPLCDAIVRGVGSTLWFLRDTTGVTTLWEWSVEPAGTVFQSFLGEFGLRVWPQCGDTLGNKVILAGRLGTLDEAGVIYAKEKLQGPVEVQTISTNFATAGQKGNIDWACRCVTVYGDVAYVGSSARENHNAMVYRVTDEEHGVTVHPAYYVAVAGPVYSIGTLPIGATGALGSERLHFSVTKAHYYRDRDNGSDPTTDAATGSIQFPDIDYGLEDHTKIARFVEVALSSRSTGGTVQLQYRVNPQTFTAPWLVAGSATVQGLNHFALPDDNPATQNYGLSFRTIQLRIVLTKATSGTLRDVVDSVAIDVARVVPLSASPV